VPGSAGSICFQDLVGTPKLGVLALQPGDLSGLLGRHTRAATGIDLLPPDPGAQGLGCSDAEPAGDRGDRAAHCEGESGRTSATIRTARSRSSSEYCLDVP